MVWLVALIPHLSPNISPDLNFLWGGGLQNDIPCILDTFYDNLKATNLESFTKLPTQVFAGSLHAHKRECRFPWRILIENIDLSSKGHIFSGTLCYRQGSLRHVIFSPIRLSVTWYFPLYASPSRDIACDTAPPDQTPPPPTSVKYFVNGPLWWQIWIKKWIFTATKVKNHWTTSLTETFMVCKTI